jgi:hypothetical protein
VASDIVSIMKKASAAGRTRLKRIVRIGTHRRWPKRNENRQEWSSRHGSFANAGARESHLAMRFRVPGMEALPLDYEAYARNGLPALQAVFVDTDPAEATLERGIERAAVVYPASPLSLDQLDAIRHAAASVGDQAAYLTMLEYRTSHQGYQDGLMITDRSLLSLTENWLLPLSQLEHYESVDGVQAVLDHALHSAQGHWGMLMSHEGHAVVAGTAAFVEPLLDSFPVEGRLEARSSVGRWLEDTRGLWDVMGGSGSGLRAWEPTLTLHVYGDAHGRDLLRAHGWIDFAR